MFSRMAKQLEITVLPSGVSMQHLGEQAYDWDSIRHLAEKGVPFGTIAAHFKGLRKGAIADCSLREGWLTPYRTKKMRHELATKQKRALRRSGSVRPANEVMQEIWQERQASMDERTFAIAKKAIKGVTDEVASNLITEAKDLKTIVDVVRKVTGQDKREAEELDAGPQMAIAVNFLRSTGPESIEVIDV